MQGNSPSSLIGHCIDTSSYSIFVLHHSYFCLLWTKKYHFLSKRSSKILSSHHSNLKYFLCTFLPKKHTSNSISPQSWRDLASHLYNIPNYFPPIQFFHFPTLDFLSPSFIRRAILKLIFGKSPNIKNLQAKFLKHGKFILPPFISTLFNNIIC